MILPAMRTRLSENDKYLPMQLAAKKSIVDPLKRIASSP